MLKSSEHCYKKYMDETSYCDEKTAERESAKNVSHYKERNK